MSLSYLWQSEEELDAFLLDELTFVSLRYPELTDCRIELAYQWLELRIDNPQCTRSWLTDQFDNLYLPHIGDREFSRLLDTLWDTVDNLMIDLSRVPWAYTLFIKLCRDFNSEHWYLLCKADIDDAVEAHDMGTAPLAVAEWINSLEDALQVEVVHLQKQFVDLVEEINDLLRCLEEY